MTSDQRNKLFGYWWPQACAAQGWDAKDREFRLKVLGQLAGRDLDTATHLDNRDEFTAIKRGLLALVLPGATLDSVLATSLSPSARAVEREEDQRRVYLHKIGTFPAAYVEEVCRDKFYGTWPPSKLFTKQLHDLVVTVENRMRAKRRNGTADHADNADEESELSAQSAPPAVNSPGLF